MKYRRSVSRSWRPPPHTKVVRNTNGHAMQARRQWFPTAFADLAEGNGEYLIDHLRRHSLPLFGYAMPACDVGMPCVETQRRRRPSVKNPATIYFGHSPPSSSCRLTATTVGMTRLSANPQSVTRGSARREAEH